MWRTKEALQKQEQRRWKMVEDERRWKQGEEDIGRLKKEDESRWRKTQEEGDNDNLRSGATRRLR